MSTLLSLGMQESYWLFDTRKRKVPSGKGMGGDLTSHIELLARAQARMALGTAERQCPWEKALVCKDCSVMNESL